MAYCKCPFPDCGHIGLMITKTHCKNEHNMDREEVFEKYGEPTIMKEFRDETINKKCNYIYDLSSKMKNKHYFYGDRVSKKLF